MATSRWTGERGCSLLEALIASTIMTVAVGGLAQLATIATEANRSARITTYASVLAAQKMEQLRGLAWGFDSLGLPITDLSTDTTVVPPKPAGGTGLSPSPPGSLGANTFGYCDYLDASGRSLGGGTHPPAGAVYIRRWSVEPLPANPGNAIVLQVMVTTRRSRGTADNSASVRRLPDEARLTSVKTRSAG